MCATSALVAMVARTALRRLAQERFADRVRLVAVGGRGGLGAVAFESRFGSPNKRRPAGGSGGRGGDVVVVARSAVDALDPRRTRVAGGRGGDGGPSLRRGRDAAATEVSVPRGTVATVGGESVDLFVDGASLLAARGGRGGWGNGVGGRRRAAGGAEFGHAAADDGEEALVDLELKILADVALVGLPNAGKSSLLRALSNADIKVAAYAFTTLAPQLGVVNFAAAATGDADAVRVLDVPGLVEDAHAGRGMGGEFLRHVERSAALLHVVDGAAADPAGDFLAIRAELAAYSPAVAAKSYAVVLNKVDVAEDAAAKLDALRAAAGGAGVVSASAVTGAGLPALALDLRALARDSLRALAR